MFFLRGPPVSMSMLAAKTCLCTPASEHQRARSTQRSLAHPSGSLSNSSRPSIDTSKRYVHVDLVPKYTLPFMVNRSAVSALTMVTLSPRGSLTVGMFAIRAALTEAKSLERAQPLWVAIWYACGGCKG